MNIVDTLFKRFGPLKLKKGQMYFRYASLYHVKEISEGRLYYNTDGHWDAFPGTVSSDQGYEILGVSITRTIFGHRIVFHMGSGWSGS